MPVNVLGTLAGRKSRCWLELFPGLVGLLEGQMINNQMFD